MLQGVSRFCARGPEDQLFADAAQEWRRGGVVSPVRISVGCGEVKALVHVSEVAAVYFARAES